MTAVAPKEFVAPAPRRHARDSSDKEPTQALKRRRQDELEKRRRDDKNVEYLKNHVLTTTVSAQNIVYHGGAISIKDAKLRNFEKDKCVWFAFEKGHSQDYGAKYFENGTLTSYKLSRSLLLLDLRSTSYAPCKPFDEEEDDEEEEEDEKEEEEEEDNLFFDHFADQLERTVSAFGAGYDTDLAEKLRQLNVDRKLGFDGYVSFDYGMFTEVILFDADPALLEYQESFDPLTEPQTTGHNYGRLSLIDEVFEKASLLDMEDGDIEEHITKSEAWNAACKNRPISPIEKLRLGILVNNRMDMLEMGLFFGSSFGS